ncbi:28392_t:CDS:2 [Gigaspora margarita]|uniref:28392_t:CDS:1 n=1 Tax=Gigaspora margarita TaxID=4874 RepID=A0ABM8VYU5_GIGMA|nr:28392_t:CDS:2 [Gigaspora margarita]
MLKACSDVMGRVVKAGFYVATGNSVVGTFFRAEYHTQTFIASQKNSPTCSTWSIKTIDQIDMAWLYPSIQKWLTQNQKFDE